MIITYLRPLRHAVFINSDKAIAFPGYVDGFLDDRAYPFITNDGAANWGRMLPEAVGFDAVSFFDPAYGWAVTRDSRLCETQDGGLTWAEVSRLKRKLFEIKVTGESIAWGFVSNEVWHTSDRGATWSVSVLSVNISEMYILNSTTGWFAGTSYPDKSIAIYRTTDSGATWERLGLQHSRGIQDMYFVDEYNGWLASSSEGIYRTNDGGRNWVSQSIPDPPVTNYIGTVVTGVRINSISFVNPLEGWAAGTKFGTSPDRTPVLLRTSDGGETWETVPAPTTQGQSFRQVFFSTPQDGWLVDDDQQDNVVDDQATIYRTIDGGRSWKAVLSLRSPWAEPKGR
jgi:photosystem II stability/assembly factor-like uncharacterized protein